MPTSLSSTKSWNGCLAGKCGAPPREQTLIRTWPATKAGEIKSKQEQKAPIAKKSSAKTKPSKKPEAPEDTISETTVNRVKSEPAPVNISNSNMGHRPNLHIDLQIHISPESTPDQIETIFASMAKHLYGVDNS